MIRRKMFAWLLAGIAALLLPPSVSTLNCLVIRPGRGLVSEKCPNNAVACRMRIENSAVVWYEYSKLYDRNHLACILEGEYSRLSSSHKDWCARKDRGTMRCWCAGNNCNEAPKIRRVYRAFIESEERNKMSNEVPPFDFQASTAPPFRVPERPSTVSSPSYYTRIFVPPTTTISNFVHIDNNYVPLNKAEAYLEATTTTTMQPVFDDRRRGADKSDTSSSQVVRSNSVGTLIVVDGITHANSSTSFSMKLALIGISAATLFTVQIGYCV